MHAFSCNCLRTRKIFLPLYRSWETAHDFDFFLNNFNFKFSIKD